MRPAGEVRVVLLETATRLVQAAPQAPGPTVRELSVASGVSYSATLHTTKNLARAGALCITGRRKVPYRNKPVAEYKPKELAAQASPPSDQQEQAAPDFTALSLAWK